MKVVPFEEKYRKDVQAICLEQSTSRYKEDKFKQRTLALYCDPYLENELAYVLLDDQDYVIGYILCAIDPYHFQKTMEPYLKKLKELDESFLERGLQSVQIGEHHKEYPAHLHIDLKESCAHKGGGTMLMTHLLNELRKRNVEGIHLGVDASNIRAVNFYTKMGFTPVLETPQFKLMVKKL